MTTAKDATTMFEDKVRGWSLVDELAAVHKRSLELNKACRITLGEAAIVQRCKHSRTSPEVLAVQVSVDIANLGDIPLTASRTTIAAQTQGCI